MTTNFAGLYLFAGVGCDMNTISELSFASLKADVK
jgi:hypothetical protein